MVKGHFLLHSLESLSDIRLSNLFLHISICVCFQVKGVWCLCAYSYDRDRGVLWGSIATRACLQLRLPYLAAAQLHGIFGMTKRKVCGTDRERQREVTVALSQSDSQKRATD